MLEFSAHYDRSPGEKPTDSASLRFRGFTKMTTNSRGQWMQSEAGPKFARGLPIEFARHVQRKSGTLDFLQHLMPARLEATLGPLGYFGPIGIDAFVWRDGQELRDHCLVEINARYTMGRVALELQKKLAGDRVLNFRIVHTSKNTAIPSDAIVLNNSGLNPQWLATIRYSSHWSALSPLDKKG